ncbi:MAG: HNH endonuclease [Myxococcales bacterium]|nr:HNH endonuclease [Myxococcales bacterium]
MRGSLRSGAGNPAPPATAPRGRVEPLSPASVRVEFTASVAFRDKLEQASALLSHTVPGGDLATILELALDVLIERETKRRSGAGKPRKRRETKPGSRHVPVEVQRAVRERDGDQCTFTDAEGRRCSAKRFLTIEHIDPFAKGGPTTVDNCCLLCRPHNAHRARQVFGEEHIQNEISEARARRKRNTPLTPMPAPEGGVSGKGARSAGSDGVQASGCATGRRASADARGEAAARADASRDARHSHTVRRFGHTPTKGCARDALGGLCQRQRRGHACGRGKGAHLCLEQVALNAESSVCSSNASATRASTRSATRAWQVARQRAARDGGRKQEPARSRAAD